MKPKRKFFRKAHLLAIFLFLLLLTGFYHSGKPLPEGLGYRGEPHVMPAEEIVFLRDLTFSGTDGAPVREQEIFDAIFALIDGAERFIMADMFLFNSFSSSGAAAFRNLADELVARLAARKKSLPSLPADFITDPINVVYGGGRSKQLEALAGAGVNVILTDLDRLRDSNPAYSALWRSSFRWFGNSGGGYLPHPFSDVAPGVSLRSYLRMLNFKANHRKVLVVDRGDGMATLVSSANPHDGSSSHSNVALVIPGDIGREVLMTEEAVALLSGETLGSRVATTPQASVSPGTGRAEVVLLTENRIKEEVLSLIDGCGESDSLWVAMFYLSDRTVVEALLAAASRGGRVRLILDPNRDAFGYEKIGIPNRPVARELVEKSGGRIEVRWYDTSGEQFHSKLVFVESADGTGRVILGSANLTRRNLDAYNLELDVRVTAEVSGPPMADIRDYLERLWTNRDGGFTVDYGAYAEHSTLKTLIYRFQEFTGMSSF